MKPKTQTSNRTTQDAPETQELRPERIGAELRPERIGERLRPERIGDLARELPAWRITDEESLLRTWSFPDGECATRFAAFAAALGEAAGHPPVVRQFGARVTVRLTSPTAGGLTTADVALAEQLGAAG